MADDVGARDVMALHDVRQQWQQRLDLRIREGAVAELVAGVDQLDPDAGPN